LGWFGLLAEVSFWSAWHGAVSCGCLGSGLRVRPWVLLGVDLGAVALLLWARPAGEAAPRLLARGTWSGWALGAVGLLAVGLASAGRLGPVQAAGASRPWRVLQPTSWLGQPCPFLADVRGVSHDLFRGSWEVFLSRRSCPLCQGWLPLWKQDRVRPPGVRCLVVEVPTQQGAGEGFPEFHDGYLRPDVAWVVATPVVVHLIEGQVVKVEEAAALRARYGEVQGD
jgi:hypothetical protein